MIEIAPPREPSSERKFTQIPPLLKQDVKSQPFAEPTLHMLEDAVGKYPTATLVGGFFLGGLLGWLLKR
jgi:hypothetical protein